MFSYDVVKGCEGDDGANMTSMSSAPQHLQVAPFVAGLFTQDGTKVGFNISWSYPEKGSAV